jgi:hypothetical protein
MKAKRSLRRKHSARNTAANFLEVANRKLGDDTY